MADLVFAVWLACGLAVFGFAGVKDRERIDNATNTQIAAIVLLWPVVVGHYIAKGDM